MEKYDKVITKFGQAWIDRDPLTIMNLIASKNLQYYETNFGPPTTEWNEVKKLWDIVPENQTDVTWWHEILISENGKVLAHVRVSRVLTASNEKQEIDAAFLFGFDASDKINYFRQWRSVQ